MSMNEPMFPQQRPPPEAGGDWEDGDEGRTGEVARRAETEGRKLAGSAAEEARSVGETAQEQAGHVADEARGQARALLSSTSSNLEQQAEEQTHKLADVLRSASEQSRALAEGRPEAAGDVNGYVRELAGTLGDIADRIDRLGARGSIEELQQFARRRPGVFLAGATAAGFVTSRLVRNAAGGAGSGGRHDADADSASRIPAATPAVTPAQPDPLATPEDPTVSPVLPPPAGAHVADDPPSWRGGGPDAGPGTEVR